MARAAPGRAAARAASPIARNRSSSASNPAAVSGNSDKRSSASNTAAPNSAMAAAFSNWCRPAKAPGTKTAGVPVEATSNRPPPARPATRSQAA